MSRTSKNRDDRGAAAVARPVRARRSTARQAGRFCIRCLLVLVAGGCVILTYLHWVGIPGWACNRWLAAQDTQHRFLHVERITFNVLEGLVAHEFAYFETPQRVLPVLEAQRVDVEFRVSDWLRGQSGWQGMTVEDATVRVAPGSSLVHAPPSHILTLTDLAGVFTWDRDFITVNHLRGDLLGVHIAGRGRVRVAADPGASTPQLTDGGSAPLPRAGSPSWLPELVGQLNQVQFDQAPNLDITFDLSPRDPTTSVVQVQGSGGVTRIRGTRFSRWALDAQFDQGTLTLPTVSLQEESRTLEATLTYHLGRKELTGSMTCDLPPAQWRSLIPVPWRDQLEQRGFLFSGPTRWAVSVGPTPLAEAWRSLTGTLDAEKAEIRGLWLERFQCAFESGDTRLRLFDMDVSVGVDGEHGSFRGEFNWSHADNRYTGSLQSELDFAGLAPLLNEKQMNLARSYRLSGPPLSADVRFEGRQGDREAFRITGDVSGADVFYRGVYVNRGHTRLLVSNRVVQLDDLHVERDEGAVDGHLRLDFENKIVSLDMAGQMDAKAIGRVSVPTVERTLRNFEFGAPIQAEVVGDVYYGEAPRTHLLIRAGGDDISLRAYRSDHLDVDILYTNGVVNVRAFDADIYGGTVTGAYQVIFSEPGLPSRYQLSARAHEISFEDVVRTMAHREGEPYRGQISGSVVLDGVLASGHGAEAVGTGSIEIVDGRIMSIPVFFGLSRGLSSIYPGLGFASQTGFAADFEVRDLHLHSRNVELEGDLFSLQGKGRYGILEQTLDFDVEFKLLRGGNVGTVVRIVTLPITKLLKFDLEGTLTESRWRPKNLPRELFTVFE